MEPDLYIRERLVVLGFALVISGSARYIHAQTSAPARAGAHFDVAAIKPAGPNEQMSQRVTPSGTWFANGVTLRFLVTLAWRVRDDQVSGGPSWLDNDRWDIVAKSESDPELKEFQPMVQMLLKERFKLSVHETERDGPIYELVKAKRGARLETPKDGDCTRNTSPPCGGFQFLERRHLIGKSVTMPVLALALARILQKTVADRTNIQGAWNMDVNWDPAQSDGPSIFTALEEQAGLRLQPGRGPVPGIVVNSAEKPTEN